MTAPTRIAMSRPRLLKKYPNRRLYDTRVSSYVTLQDVRQLVLDGEAFEIRDSASGEDITRTVLLQIIGEQEEGGPPMLSVNALQLMIRFYDDPLRGFMGRYIERGLQLFLEQQHALRKQLGGLIGSAPFALLNQIADRNLDLWKNLQQGVLKGGILSTVGRRKTKAPAAPASAGGQARKEPGPGRGKSAGPAKPRKPRPR